MSNTIKTLFFFLMAHVAMILPVSGQVVVTPASPDSTLNYFEPLSSGKTRFYFDQNYFLSDKLCPFTSIERDASFDYSNNRLDGEFVDHDLQGNIILMGHYAQGLKQGEFKAYHGNGQLKWEVSYEQDQPIGLARYYYPDGLPMITVRHGEQGIEIRDYWDQRAVQRVRNGRGRYEMRVEIDGYNEYGAEFISRRGQIRDGKPHGLWSVDFVYADQSTEHVGTERYRQGRLDRTYNETLSELLGESSPVSLLPIQWFLRGEILMGKKCLIDEQSGFTMYLQDLLEGWFGGRALTWIDATRVRYDVQVDLDGSPLKVEPIQTLEYAPYARAIQDLLENIRYIPSWLDDEYIADDLTVSFDVYFDAELSALRFYYVEVKREKGF